ncbi:galactose-3-O-sulfotransferase 4-like [Mercenaria mercenaria]|uniref:galactose-3-O-sulfotransferase 4-like n=1 Tax=Mercenaria mercenaria TaxID=6596 RepID=UPI00234E87A0|nr:galactose-3-O-sulfotransferase 4-like [Mercenaria mercenaria]
MLINVLQSTFFQLSYLLKTNNNTNTLDTKHFSFNLKRNCKIGFIMKRKKFAFLVFVLVALLSLLQFTHWLKPLSYKGQLPYTKTEVKQQEPRAFPPQTNVAVNSGERRTYSDIVNKEMETVYTGKTRTILSNNHIETKESFEKDAPSENVSIPYTTGENSLSKASLEVSHIEFLKVHKAASTTVQNVIMRFGLKRNLSFVIPTPRHYISVEKTYFSDLWPPLPNRKYTHKNRVQNNKASRENNKFDILCNHMVFNSKKVSRLLHDDSVYIAIVREPFDQFLSAAFYYKFKWKYPYLAKLPNETFITDLIRNPRQNEATTMSESMTYNSMAYDFGFNLGTIVSSQNKSQEQFDEFLNETGNIFHLVMVFEKFDESLVLLKRYLNWSLEDILYIQSNTFSLDAKSNVSKIYNITANDTITFRKRNKFDYGLYNFFKARLEKQIDKEILFKEEVSHFKKIQRDVQTFCLEEMEETVYAIMEMLANYTFSEKMSSQVTRQMTSKAERETFKNITRKEPEIKQKEPEKLLAVINSVITYKEMTKSQASELRELANLQSKESFKWPRQDLISLLPLLFYDKGKEVGDKTRKAHFLVSKSKWNKQFFVTSSDCKLLTMDEMSLFNVVKNQHLKLLVRRKFGENFSIIEAIRYILTFY